MPSLLRQLPATFLAGLMSAMPAAHAATYFVATDGLDSNAGNTLAAPFRTLDRAIEAVRPGDTIELRTGNYRGAIVDIPGTEKAWIRLRAYKGEKVRLTAHRADKPTLYFYHRSCDEKTRNNYPCQPLYWTVEGLEIDGSGAEHAVKIDTPHVRVAGNNLHGSSTDIIKVVRTADDVEITGNEIHHPRARPGANAQGIDIVGADRVRVANNHVHDIPSTGMYAKGNARDTVFEANLVENTYEHGIMLGQSTDAYRLLDGKYETYDGIMRNNVVKNAGWSCFATASSLRVHILNNSCYQTHSNKHGAILLSNESEVRQPGSEIEIRNNLIVGDAGLPMIKVTRNALIGPDVLVLDHNLYWTQRGTSGISFSWYDRGLDEISLSKWRRETGQDTHSLDLDPLLDSNVGLLRPGAASPAANAGMSSALVTTDFSGNKRPATGVDIGAHEFRP